MKFTKDVLGRKQVVAEVGDKVYFTHLPMSENKLLSKIGKIVKIIPNKNIFSPDTYVIKIENSSETINVNRSCFELCLTTEMTKYFSN